MIPKHLLQPLCLTWIPALQGELVIRKNITFFRSSWWVLNKFKSTWSSCSTSCIRLDVNNNISFCNLLKVFCRVLSPPEDNFLGWSLLFSSHRSHIYIYIYIIMMIIMITIIMIIIIIIGSYIVIKKQGYSLSST